MNDYETYVFTDFNRFIKLLNTASFALEKIVSTFRICGAFDIDFLEKEICAGFKALMILKKLQSNDLIIVDYDAKAFKVMDNYFVNIDDAVKAANNKVFL